MTLAIDKQMHAAVNFGMVLAGHMLARRLGCPHPDALLLALSGALVVSAAKEVLWDWAMGRGTPEWLDFVADVFGVAAAAVFALLFGT